MIYIITPKRFDFIDMCRKHGYPYQNTKSSSNVIWINRVDQLLGRNIHPENDTVIKGDLYYMFSPEELNRVEFELAFRKRK